MINNTLTRMLEEVIVFRQMIRAKAVVSYPEHRMLEDLIRLVIHDYVPVPWIVFVGGITQQTVTRWGKKGHLGKKRTIKRRHFYEARHVRTTIAEHRGDEHRTGGRTRWERGIV